MDAQAREGKETQEGVRMRLLKGKRIQQVITKAGRVLGKYRSRKRALAQIGAIKARERRV
jgi:hypothetical protein